MFEQLSNQKTKIIYYSILLLNVIISLLTLLHQFKLPIILNIIGILGILTIVLDYILIYLFFKIYQYKLRMRIFMKGFYIYSFIAFFVEFLFNFLGYGQIAINPRTVQNILLWSYMGIFLYAAALIYTHMNWLNTQSQSQKASQIELKKDGEIPKRRKIWLIASITFNSLFLGFGIFVDYSYFFAIHHGMFFFLMGVFCATMSLLFALMFTGKTFQIMSCVQQLLKSSKTKSQIIFATVLLGVCISTLSFVPVLGVSAYARDAREEFNRAFDPEFGGDWEAQIPITIEKYLKSDYFQVLDYFIGPDNPDCIVKRDILYFNGSESAFSVDQSILLYFDAYLPPNNGVGLPGENSTLIRIHGGGWTIGDKAEGNIPMMNRYFASQGYTVFDIQYGLNNETSLFSNIPYRPDNVMGNFTIDDMLRHIGNFTYYLADHASEYGANLDSVFVSGGSAGGQLTCATALSLSWKNYTEFTNKFTIKGLIPFYPGNNVTLDFAQSSRPEWVNPVLLLNASSPPCLLFQGKQDPLVLQSRAFQDAYFGFGKTDCALITFPFAGHAADIYFPGFYNQIFLYYMERFLYLYH